MVKRRIFCCFLLLGALPLVGCATWQAPPVETAAGAHAASGSDRTPVPETEPEPAVALVPDPEPLRLLEQELVLDEYLFPESLIEDPTTASPLDELAVIDPDRPVEPAEDQLDLVEAAAPTFDIPIEINDQVLAWVDRYSHKHKTSFEAGLKRSGRYLKMFREIFAEAGLPQDLVYMAHVESGYKTSAYSRARARGIYQFIAATGRRYGLRVDYWVDERSDPEKSAHAAAAYMKDLYAEFDDWYLALAAYNAGEGKIRRAIRSSGQRDFWEISRRRLIRRETRNHIPAILAATLLSKEPEKYGLKHRPDPFVVYDTIQVEGGADLRVLARCAGTDVATLTQLNPALRRHQTPPDGITDVRVPAGMAATARAALEAIPPKERVLYAEHRVLRGDTLSVIARNYGVTVQAIQSANNMGRRTMIREKQMLRIPTSSSRLYGGQPVIGAGHGEVVNYRVRRGDTLSRIARDYGTTPASVAAASDISVRDLLHIGDRLTVVRGIRSPSEARHIARGGTVARAAPAAAKQKDGALVHVVRRGDTLWRIATLYRTTVNALCSMNSISPRSIIHPGTKLTVGYP